MATAILDVQCVLSAENKYLIKEMSVIDVDGGLCQHWIFKTPNEMQNARSRSVNKWLHRNYQVSLTVVKLQRRRVRGNRTEFEITRFHVYVRERRAKTKTHRKLYPRRLNH